MKDMSLWKLIHCDIGFTSPYFEIPKFYNISFEMYSLCPWNNILSSVCSKFGVEFKIVLILLWKWSVDRVNCADYICSDLVVSLVFISVIFISTGVLFYLLNKPKTIHKKDYWALMVGNLLWRLNERLLCKVTE